MSKTIAVFGAGAGLGISTARRFGREGYQVAMIGRRAHTLGMLVDQLMEEGINAAAFPADLAQTSSNPKLIYELRPFAPRSATLSADSNSKTVVGEGDTTTVSTRKPR